VKKRSSSGLRILNWLGPVQRQRLVHNVWLELIVIGCFVLVGTAAYGTTSVLLAHQHNVQRQPKALALAHTQIEALRASNGLAGGDQCFDGHGAPHAASEPGAPCSYTPSGEPGCLDGTAPYCYAVRIMMVSAEDAITSQSSVPVTYRVEVSWPGRSVERGQVSLDYRIIESNSAYAAEGTGRSGSGGAGDDATIGVSNGVVGGVGTTLGGRFINTLADIPGGPSVSINTASCSVGSGCTVHSGAYDLTGHFALSTNIPDKLIASCTWNFGDGTSGLQIISTQTGCFDGQIVNHSYADTWQMQPVPPYPAACASPLGTSLDAYTFLVGVTLHTTSGVDIASVSPHHTAMPSCAN
jgi:hypothetical protein